MDCFAKGCKNGPVIELKYCGEPLCSKHFLKKTWKRIKRHTAQEDLISSGDRIAIGYSAGKDSTVLLHVLHELFSKRKDISIVAITVDEGIFGYRAHSLGLAKKTCKKLGIKHIVISARKEFGKPLDSVVRGIPRDSEGKGLTPCSYCGVIRRYLLNKAAQREGCTKVATGHNLDDEAESVIMDFVRGDVQKMVRLGAKVGVSRFKGFVQRVKPLRIIPEREVAVFAMLNGWEFDSAVCPYASTALRETVRNAMNSIEDAHPGTKYSIVSTADRILPVLRKGFFRAEPRICGNCGELSSRETCRFCEYMSEGKPSRTR
ncbi:MAG: TIGR00269 family protein [archaeon]